MKTKIRTNSNNFKLICEIMDDFLSSQRVRCIECCCIITDPEMGAICNECYDPMNYLDGDDE